MSLSFDSNVLIYAADRGAGVRHDRASLLVESALRLRRGMLTLQALAEFYMLWATADRAGVRWLVTEDFQDGRVIGGVTFVDPFNPANAPLLQRELPPPA